LRSYTQLAAGWTPDNPSGVNRRHRDGDAVIGQTFTRNLGWELTDYFDWVRVGRNDDEHLRSVRIEAAVHRPHQAQLS